MQCENAGSEKFSQTFKKSEHHDATCSNAFPKNSKDSTKCSLKKKEKSTSSNVLLPLLHASSRSFPKDKTDLHAKEMNRTKENGTIV